MWNFYVTLKTVYSTCYWNFPDSRLNQVQALPNSGKISLKSVHRVPQADKFLIRDPTFLPAPPSPSGSSLSTTLSVFAWWPCDLKRRVFLRASWALFPALSFENHLTKKCCYLLIPSYAGNSVLLQGGGWEVERSPDVYGCRFQQHKYSHLSWVPATDLMSPNAFRQRSNILISLYYFYI